MVNTEKIKERLSECGLTQDDLAKHVGIATCTMNQKLNNIRVLKLPEAEKIAEMLKIEDEEFGKYFFAKPVA